MDSKIIARFSEDLRVILYRTDFWKAEYPFRHPTEKCRNKNTRRQI